MAKRIKELELAMKAIIEESKVIIEELEDQGKSEGEGPRLIEITGGFNIINMGTGNQSVEVPKKAIIQYEQSDRE